MLTDIKVGPNVLIINLGRSVMISELDGTVRGTAQQGLFVDDVRFLSHYRYLINGRKWKLITSAPLSHASARFLFTNPALLSGAGPIPKHVLGLAVERTVSGGLHEDLDLANYRPTPVRLTLEIEVGADFADMFEVRRNHPRLRRTIREHWSERDQRLLAEYARDGYQARLIYQFAESDSRARRQGHSLLFDFTLPPGGRWHTCVHVTAEIDRVQFRPASACGEAPLVDREAFIQGWHGASASLRCSDEAVTHTLRQSEEDLVSLLLDDDRPPGTPGPLAAGAPWFVALFGRDSLIAGYDALMLHRSFAVGALAELAKYQAAASDDFRDADPGKILHELRTGELARCGLIPHTPYYGSADATILYPIVLHEAYLWTGDRDLLTTYLPVAERCLAWIDRYGDLDGDGFQEYRTRSPRGIKNQGWKDSGDGVVYGDGRPVEPPVALCELQGYVYDAKMRMSALYEDAGAPERAARLRDEAGRLYERFNDAFWMDDEGTYAYGLDADKAQITSVVSNAGHCLWSGIAPRDRAERVVARLLQPDMWSGWGIRTLSADHPAFNPFAYQRGAVWPHDNALVAVGCRRYGHTDGVSRIARGIFAAASAFQRYRLPELFGGLPRDRFGFPVQYLGANTPQAWAAATAFVLVQMLLGVRADAPRGRLYVAPALPAWIEWIEASNLQVGQARASFRCWRDRGRCRVHVEDVSGSLQVIPAEDWAPLPS